MKKIELKIGDELQGKFELKKLNLLLVFQVNCPGCFTYALPFFNTLYNEFHERGISFLGMSTAFEDFDKNTVSNTQDLIQEGLLVGETKEMLSQYGYKKLPYTLDFPIVMDQLNHTDVDFDSLVNKVCNTNPYYNLWSGVEKKELYKRVTLYLKSLDKIALTFTLNQLRGTPSFILFDDNYKILDDWFGHVSHELIATKMNQFSKEYGL